MELKPSIDQSPPSRSAKEEYPSLPAAFQNGVVFSSSAVWQIGIIVVILYPLFYGADWFWQRVKSVRKHAELWDELVNQGLGQ